MAHGMSIVRSGRISVVLSATAYWAPLKLEAAENAHFLETTLELEANGGFRTRLKNVNEGCEAEPRVWRYHRWDSFTCAKMKAGIVVGCLLNVSAMASVDEGFALSVTSKLWEFTALGYPAHVLNGVIGRSGAGTRSVGTVLWCCC